MTFSNLIIDVLYTTGLAHSQQPSTSAFYGLSGYSGYSAGSTELVGANESLSLSFRFCFSDGILLHTTDSAGELYFLVGLYNSYILVQFDTGQGLREVRRGGGGGGGGGGGYHETCIICQSSPSLSPANDFFLYVKGLQTFHHFACKLKPCFRMSNITFL